MPTTQHNITFLVNPHINYLAALAQLIHDLNEEVMQIQPDLEGVVTYEWTFSHEPVLQPEPMWASWLDGCWQQVFPDNPGAVEVDQLGHVTITDPYNEVPQHTVAFGVVPGANALIMENPDLGWNATPDLRALAVKDLGADAPESDIQYHVNFLRSLDADQFRHYTTRLNRTAPTR